MTFVTESARVGRQPCTVVEIDLDYCAHTYGVAPCTASLSVSFPQKCFNTRKSCQDAPNYSALLKTYRFSDVQLPLGVSGEASFPCIESVQSGPTKIDPTRSLGARASITVKLTDFPGTDRGIDKYVDERTYDPTLQGSFWGKLRSRTPYYQGRVLRLRTGFLTTPFDWANFETRTYLIDSINGPNAKGEVTIIAKDPLKLADDDKAVCPAVTDGILVADINNAVTALTMSPAGIGDLQYPASGTIIIGSELMDFTRVADAMTVTRGVRGSVADQHTANDAIQLCKVFSALTPSDILYDLLVNFAFVPAIYIDKPAWDAECSTWLGLTLMSTVICKPTGVKTLIQELVQQALVYIWWDEREATIPLRAIRPPHSTEVTQLSDANNFLMQSFTITDRPEQRLSQVWVLYGQRDPTQEVTQSTNFARTYFYSDGAAESPDEYDESRVRIIYSRWIPAGTGFAQAALLAFRVLSSYRDNPRQVTFKLDPKDCALWTGDICEVTTRCIQDFDGSSKPTNLQVLQVAETIQGSEYTYQAVDSFFQGRYGFITPNGWPTFTTTTEADKQVHGFICYNSGFFLDGTPAYKVI